MSKASGSHGIRIECSALVCDDEMNPESGIALQPVALIIVFNGNNEILLLKRPDDVHCGSLWSFPGGKVEAGETPLDAAKRELAEETGLTGQNWRLLGEYQHDYPDRTLYFHLFGCDCLDPDALNSDVSYVWVSAERLGEYPMPDANQALLELARLEDF